MKRTTLNLVVDLAAGLLLLGMIATGYILRFPLPPGTNKSHSLWGLTRHCWGSAHTWISFGLLAALLVHLVLHWHWLVSVIAKRLGAASPSEKRSGRIGLVAAAVAGGAVATFAWVANRGVESIQDAELFEVCPPEEAAPWPASADEGEGQSGLAERAQGIFERSCLECHGPRRAAGDFRVDQRESFLAAGGSGPMVVPGKGNESPLIEIVSGRRTDLPRQDRHRLPGEDVAVLRTWIDAGAPWPEG